jgi:hypothetical protein
MSKLNDKRPSQHRHQTRLRNARIASFHQFRLSLMERWRCEVGRTFADRFERVPVRRLDDSMQSDAFCTKLVCYLRWHGAPGVVRNAIEKGSGDYLADWVNLRGRPFGRIVDSRSSRRAVDSTQASSPNGLDRRMQHRNLCSVFAASGSFTCSVQFGMRGIGHGEIAMAEQPPHQFQRLPHRQSSARIARPAAKAFRST